MRVIEVKSCRECRQYRRTDWSGSPFCTHPESPDMGEDYISPRTKTFPKFCPLKEAKT